MYLTFNQLRQILEKNWLLPFSYTCSWDRICSKFTDIQSSQQSVYNFQGSRLTAFELVHDKIPATLIADSAAAALMNMGQVQAVIVGADRIAANGNHLQ
jgi:hypothetical protein